MRQTRVLIVDDEPELAKMLAQRLRAAGLEVRLSPDGRQALETLRAWRPDAVLSDIQMPELDGWQLCKAIRADPALKRVPVLLMSAWSTADGERRAAESGARGLLLKPFDERKLASLMQELAGRPGRKSHAASVR